MIIQEYYIKDIVPADYNPRKISEKELENLKKSIKRFGFVEPLVVNKRNNVLVGGHQRLKAALDLGYTKVPVYEVDLNETEEKILNIKLNDHTSMGKFDVDILDGLISEIKDIDLEIDFSELTKSLKMDFDPKPKKERLCPHCGESL